MSDRNINDIPRHRNVSEMNGREEAFNGSTLDYSQMALLLPICESANIAMICIVVWIFICMIVYGKRTRKWRISSSEKAKLDGGKIYIACIVTVAWTIPRLALSQLLFHPHVFPDCENLMDVGVIAYYIVMWQVYFFLWLRHRAIYAHPTVKAMMGKYSNIVSWAMLVILSVISVGVLCGFTIPHSYKLIEIGCVISEKIDGIVAWNVSANLILGSFLIVSQTTFLGLFIYPMVVTKDVRKRNLSAGSAKSTPKKQQKKNGKVSCIGENRCPTLHRLGSTIKREKGDSISSTLSRSILGATIAVGSDLLVALVTALCIPGTVPRAITVTIYDVSLLISIFGIMATFGANANILLVFWCKKTRKQPRSRENSRSRTLSTEIFD